jgi:PhnB protein
MAVKPIPDGYHSVTPMIVAEGAGKLIDFMKQAFDAEERLRMPMPGGSVAHAELTIGDSVVMVSDATPQWPAVGCSVHLYVEDVDAVYKRALEAGATSRMAPEDRFYGDRAAAVEDPSGNLWSLATHIEDVAEDEMVRRMATMMPS